MNNTLKFVQKLSLLICCIITSISINAQTKAELLKTIDDNIKGIDQIMMISTMQLQIKPVVDKKFNEKDAFNFEDIKVSEQVDKNKVEKHFKDLEISSTIYYPYTDINIRTDEYELLKILGKDNFYFSHNPDMQPKFIPTQISFLDGTTMQVKDDYLTYQKVIDKYTKKENEEETIDMSKASEIEQWIVENNSSFSETFILNNTKAIKSLQFNIQLPIKKQVIYPIEKNGVKIETKAGVIEVLAIAGNELVYQYPTALSDKIEIRGLYKDGRILREKGSNSNTIYSDSMIAGLKQLQKAFIEAKKLVEAGTIKTSEDFETYMQANTPAVIANADEHNELENNQKTQRTVTFSGPLNKVIFLIDNGEMETLHFTTNYELNYSNDELEYRVAGEFATMNTGIINNKGEWLIPPQYDKYFRMANQYYFTDQIDDRENIYHLDPINKKLQKVDYRLDDYEIFLGKYVKIEKEINGLNGVADAISGKIILPIEYETIHLEGNKFWVGRDKNEKSGALDTDLKTIIPFEFKRVAYNDGFLFTENFNDKVDVYNAKGENITQGRYNEVDDGFTFGRLLVTKYDKTETKNSINYANYRYYFLDTAGNVTIDLQKLGLENPKIFRDGLAAVQDKKTEKWGFIDTDGNIVLPCIYGDVSFGFFETSHYAPVQLPNGKDALIDKKGKVIKTFTSSFDIVSYKGEGEHSNLCLRVNGVWYDSFGERVNE